MKLCIYVCIQMILYVRTCLYICVHHPSIPASILKFTNIVSLVIHEFYLSVPLPPRMAVPFYITGVCVWDSHDLTDNSHCLVV